MGEHREGRAFVGRGAELARLRMAYDDCLDGRGRTALVVGEAGIGKTRLVAEFADEARRDGAQVLEGACLDVGDGALPYGPFVEILRELVADTEPGRLPALLGPARVELGRLLPELATRLPGPASEPASGDGHAQSRLFELILGVLERAARARPLVVIVEDLQWADRATLDLVTFLARSLRDDAVLLVLTARMDESIAGGGVLAAIAEIERDAAVERIDVGPLGRDDLARQLHGLLGTTPAPGLVERILERTDGNPFYAEQLVAAGEADRGSLPPRLRDVLTARLATLSPEARDVLRVAAAAGRQVDDELVAAALERSSRAVAASLREAVEHGALVAGREGDGTGYAFRHTLLQEHVAGELFPAERIELHAAFARALEARQARGDRPVTAAELARHWDAARLPAPAYRATVAAARDAASVYAFTQALRLWERALELRVALGERGETVPEPLGELEQEAAEAAVLAGEYERAVAHGRAAVAAFDPAAEPLRAGGANERLRWYLWEAGDREAAAAAVQEALRLLPVEPPSIARSRALAQLAGIELYAGDYAASRAHAEEAAAAARAAESGGEEALSLGILGWVTAATGDVEGGLARFAEGQAIAERLGAIEGIALGAANLAGLLDRVGRTEASLAAARTGLETVTRLGVGRTYGGLLLGYAAKAQLALGRWDEADEATEEGLRRGPTGRAELWLLVNRARVLVGRGRFDEAAEALDRAAATDRSVGENEYRTALLAALVELGVWRGRPEAARPVVDDGLGRAARGGPPDPSLAWLAALGLRAEADLAERARARRDGAALEVAITRAGAIGAAVDAGLASAGSLTQEPGRGSALLALIDAERRRAAGASDAGSWGATAEAWTIAGRPFPTGYARLRQAEAILGSRGPRAGAEAALREAHVIAMRLGASPLREAVEGLARLARLDVTSATEGAAEIGAATAGPMAAYALTDRETEVLRFVTGGWSNQQIADALFISRKTASVHVSNILGKLGVASRVEAAALAHRLGLGRDAPPPPDSTAQDR